MARRAKWSNQTLQQALKHICKKETSLNKASRKYEIPRRTLRDYVNKNIESKASVGRKAVLTKLQEEELKKRIFRLCDVGFPLTAKGLRKAVFQFVEENNTANPFNKERRVAGNFPSVLRIRCFVYAKYSLCNFL
jgi:transposase-like protein